MKPKMNIKKIMAKIKTTDFFIACKESRIENNTSFYGSFYLGPFDESLSQTLSNDLRRTLLSELTGLAITSIEIEGVLHQFSSLPGMKESVLDLICNFQNIVLKKQDITNIKKTYTGFLNVSGPRVIKAIDLKLPSGVQCVDPNQYIATLADDGFLNIKFNINEGKNFIKQKPYNLDVQSLKKRNIVLQDFKSSTFNIKNNINNNYIRDKSLNINVLKYSNPIPLDAIFMPVTKINCIIEENNMYSDFSTDLQKNRFNIKKLNSSFYIGAEQAQMFNNISQIKSHNSSAKYYPLFFNFLNYNAIFQTFYLKQKQLNLYKLIPWQSNSLYFSKITPKKPILDPFNKIKIFLACNTHKFELRCATQPILKSTTLYNMKNARQTGPSAQDSVVLYNMKKSHKKSSQAKNYLRANPEWDLTTSIQPKQKNIFKITARNRIIQNNMYLEYSKNLKLKPLRKKTHLIVEIWTNGSMHPRQALYDAFMFLSNVFLKLQTVKMFGHGITSPIMPRSSKRTNIRTNDNYTFKYIKSKSALKYTQKLNTMLPQLTLSSSQLTEQMPKKNVKKDELHAAPPLLKKQVILDKINTKMQEPLSTKVLIHKLKTPISILPMSLRTYTALKKSNILTLNDLIKMSKKDVLKIKNLGIKSLFEIETSLSCLGLMLKL